VDNVPGDSLCDVACSLASQNHLMFGQPELIKWKSIGKHKPVTRVLSQRVPEHHKLPRTEPLGNFDCRFWASADKALALARSR
jgi:hypothetical protein